jgi:hypothetical protein
VIFPKIKDRSSSEKNTERFICYNVLYYIMDTTIQISKRLQQELLKRKFFNKETYEEIIWDIIEDTAELNEQTKKEIAEARTQIKAGKYHTLTKVKKELGL